MNVLFIYLIYLFLNISDMRNFEMDQIDYVVRLYAIY